VFVRLRKTIKLSCNNCPYIFFFRFLMLFCVSYIRFTRINGQKHFNSLIITLQITTFLSLKRLVWRVDFELSKIPPFRGHARLWLAKWPSSLLWLVAWRLPQSSAIVHPVKASISSSRFSSSESIICFNVHKQLYYTLKISEKA